MRAFQYSGRQIKLYTFTLKQRVVQIHIKKNRLLNATGFLIISYFTNYLKIA